MTYTPPRADPPETAAQVASWERVKRHALDYGLCDRCAAQMAWGAQLGFTRVEHPPCPVCVPLVEALPNAKPNGWRVPHGSLSHRGSWVGPMRTAAHGGTDTRAGAVVRESDARSVGDEAP